MEMYPLSFREFLINSGLNKDVLDYIQSSIDNSTPIEKTIHERMRYYFKQYLIGGSMPEAVNAFFSSHDIALVGHIQKRILTSIKNYFGRYKDNDGSDKINEKLKLRAEATLDTLSSQLSKEYKKFQFSLVNTKGNSIEKAEGIKYLEDVGLVIRSYNTRELTFPLECAKIASEFNAFVLDTGLLVSLLGIEASGKIINNEIGAYKGAI